MTKGKHDRPGATRRDFMKCACAVPFVGGASSSLAATATGIIDVHAHVGLDDYNDFLEASGSRARGYGVPQPPPAASAAPDPGGSSEESLAIRIGMMDAAGVATQILSPVRGPYLEDEARAIRAARMLNDRLASIAAGHAPRLSAFVSLPLPHIAPALAEMRRGFDDLGAKGVAIHTSCLGISAADDRFIPLFEEMNRRRAVLFIHPSVNGLASPHINDWNLQAAAGPLLEDTTIALHLMVKGIPVRYSEIRIIIPHLGGGLSTMLDRLDNQLPISIPNLVARPSLMARSFWYDTVAHGSTAALAAAIEAFGASRLVPGSDFPWLLPFETLADTFNHVRRTTAGDAVASEILYQNCARLFRAG